MGELRTPMGDALEKRVEVLEETIRKATDNIKDLEERENETSEKETTNTEKIQLLEGQYREVEVRADAAKMNGQALSHNLVATEKEIAEMDDFGDDGDYIPSTPTPAPEPEPEPESEPEAEPEAEPEEEAEDDE